MGAPKIVMSRQERRLRWSSMFGMLAVGVSFQFCFLASEDRGTVSDLLGFCCRNDWRQVTGEDVRLVLKNASKGEGDPGALQAAVLASAAYANGYPMLYDTASGTALVFRILSFVFEVSTGFFMAMNMF